MSVKTMCAERTAGPSVCFVALAATWIVCSAACANTSAPSLLSFAPLSATMSVPSFAFAPSSTETAALNFEIVLRSSEPVDLQQVKIHLIDGSNIGGSPLTLVFDDLNAMFGSTHLPAGTVRALTFNPTLSCAGFKPQTVVAELGFIGPAGAQALTVRQSLW